MKTMDFQLWPEYDDPRVLAILSGTLTNNSGQDFTGRAYFNVPKDIEVKMACELINGGQHSCQPYELEDKGDYQVLSWKVTKTISPGQEYPFWLEYYYNPLQGSPEKTMEFSFIPYYKTSELKLTVKEPLKSSNFKIDPAPTTTGQDGEGFRNDYYTFQNLDADNPVNLKISYTRSETKPSVEPLNPNANQNNSSDPLGTSAWKKPEVLIPVVLFIIVLVAFIFYSLYYSKNQPPTARVDRIHREYGDRGNGGKGSGSKASGGRNSGISPQAAREKKRIRQMLLDGEISEQTYRELIEEIENDN